MVAEIGRDEEGEPVDASTGVSSGCPMVLMSEEGTSEVSGKVFEVVGCVLVSLEAWMGTGSSSSVWEVGGGMVYVAYYSICVVVDM